MLDQTAALFGGLPGTFTVKFSASAFQNTYSDIKTEGIAGETTEKQNKNMIHFFRPESL